MRQHPHLVHPRQQQTIYGAHQSGMPTHPGHHHMEGHPPKTHKRIGGPYLSQQRSFSSSEEDLRSTPDFDGESDFQLNGSVVQLHVIGLWRDSNGTINQNDIETRRIERVTQNDQITILQCRSLVNGASK